MDNINNDNMIDPLETVADYIISQANFGVLTENDRNYIKGSLILQLNRRLGLLIMENLPAEGCEEYSRLLKYSPIPEPGELEKIINKYLEGSQDKIKAGLDEFTGQAIESLSKKGK